jgi:hypothetical protein
MAASRTKAAILLMAASALSMAAPTRTGAGQPMALRVSPRVATEPATLLVSVTVEPHADNRALQICVDSEGYYRSSLIQLDGGDAPRSTTSSFPNVPGGDHVVRAVLFGPGGKQRASDTSTVRVVSRWGDSSGK